MSEPSNTEKDFIVNISKPLYDNSAPFVIVNSILIDKLFKKIKDFNYKVKTTKVFSLSDISENEFFDKVKNIKGDLVQYESGYYTLINEEVVVIIYVESRLNFIKVKLCAYAEEKSICYKYENIIYNLFENKKEDEIYCLLKWLIYDNGETEERMIREKLNDNIFKEAYPYINLENYIDSYLKSDEPVLILIGPPGTGKTRLIRHILKKASIKKKNSSDSKSSFDFEEDDFPSPYRDENNSCNVMYSCSKEIIEKGKLFIDFITENYDILVLEDIDNHLRPREKDNTGTMYNLLSASNGLVISPLKSKKIILSTNLSDIDKIDDALVRPGRCFSILQTKKLNIRESREFLKVVKYEGVFDPIKDEYSLAELYHLINFGELSNKQDDVNMKKVGF